MKNIYQKIVFSTLLVALVVGCNGKVEEQNNGAEAPAKVIPETYLNETSPYIVLQDMIANTIRIPKTTKSEEFLRQANVLLSDGQLSNKDFGELVSLYEDMIASYEIANLQKMIINGNQDSEHQAYLNQGNSAQTMSQQQLLEALENSEKE